MIKMLSDIEITATALEHALSKTEDDILKWMVDFSMALSNVSNMKDTCEKSYMLSVLNVPKGYDFKSIVNMFEQAGFRPFPVRSEYNLNNRGEMGEFIIRSVLTLYDDAAENPGLSRTENSLIARDFRAYEHLPTSIIKAGDKKTPFDRLQKTMARPNKFRS